MKTERKKSITLLFRTGLDFAADHESGNVLQEDQRNAALRAELNKVRSLLRRLRKENAVVGHNAHRHAPQPSKPRHQRVAKQLLLSQRKKKKTDEQHRKGRFLFQP